jgi:MYXO-CTERM domain-containing protein
VAGGACGDHHCSGDEDATSCAADCGACVVAAAGAIIDEDGACFAMSGPPASWRLETGETGYDGSARWTYAWDEPESNSAIWRLELPQAATYRIDVHTPQPWAGSQAARYAVTHDGSTDEILIDQTARDGWQRLGTFAFAAGAGQSIRLGDHTGEPYAERRQLVFDAVRLSPAIGPTFGGDDDGGDDDGGSMGGGCSVAPGRGREGGTAAGLMLVLAFLIRRRRRRPSSS